jgi:hypothetical protein
MDIVLNRSWLSESKEKSWGVESENYKMTSFNASCLPREKGIHSV